MPAISGAPSFDGPTVHHRLTDSTNDRARELALAGAPSGTVVVAAEQTAGRGRTGRRWSAPAGAALLCSAILRPLEAHHSLLPLAVPLAVCDATEELAPVQCQVKWPNDVWLGERKLAGVLIEARPPEWAVMGVGLNLSIPDKAFPEDLRWPATSLGHGIGPSEALQALRVALGRWAGARPEEVVAAFAERDALKGRDVGWEAAGGIHAVGAGRAEGVDSRGNLVVVTDAGERLSLGAGEVSLRL
ncbi:MAG: biotin--[acetyl-CoA-carboxylase] ligase [Actinomycetota bacterium]|nr:biotin--[acetyl-CoA-carboxylase] ligase [Actinomycetota bacterium]